MTASSGIPAKFAIVWAAAAGSSYVRAIPQASQIGIQDGAASLTDGFPPLTFTPNTAGGVPPFGQDFNGILKQLTQWSQWFSMGGPVSWDNSFSTSIGGYPRGALVQSATTPLMWWLSTADNNTTNPDAGGAGWQNVVPEAPGTIKMFAGAAAPPGYYLCQGQVIPQGGVNANLFAAIGTAYNTGGEGAGNFRLPDFRARAPFGLDPANSTGRLTAAAGNYDASALGDAGGVQAVLITQARLPALPLTFTGAPQSPALAINQLTAYTANQALGQQGSGAGIQPAMRSNPSNLSQSGFAWSDILTGSDKANYPVTPSGSVTFTPGGTVRANGQTTLGSGDSTPIANPGLIVNFIIKY